MPRAAQCIAPSTRDGVRDAASPALALATLAVLLIGLAAAAILGPFRGVDSRDLRHPDDR